MVICHAVWASFLDRDCSYATLDLVVGSQYAIRGLCLSDWTALLGSCYGSTPGATRPPRVTWSFETVLLRPLFIDVEVIRFDEYPAIWYESLKKPPVVSLASQCADEILCRRGKMGQVKNDGVSWCEHWDGPAYLIFANIMAIWIARTFLWGCSRGFWKRDSIAFFVAWLDVPREKSAWYTSLCGCMIGSSECLLSTRMYGGTFFDQCILVLNLYVKV